MVAGSVVFGGVVLVALVFSAAGLYALMAVAVQRRTREIGIRVALGARAPAVIRLVVGQGVRTATIGVILGGIAALGVTQLLANLLYGVTPRDPVILTAVVSALVTVAIVASLIPAGRATRVDPVAALRGE